MSLLMATMCFVTERKEEPFLQSSDCIDDNELRLGVNRWLLRDGGFPGPGKFFTGEIAAAKRASVDAAWKFSCELFKTRNQHTE